MSKNDMNHAKLSTYVIGFLLSLYLTFTAYWFTVYGSISRDWLIATVIGLALVQFAVQMVFFLHVGRESKPRWNLLTMSFMVLIVAILVFGSLWIMANLDYHHGDSPAEVNKTIIEDEGYKL